MPPDPAHVACSDCERIGPGPVAQPVNTLSSLAFVAAALPVWRWATATGDRLWQATAVAALAAGVGSVAYHGPGGRLGKALHDAGVAALAVTAAGAISRGHGQGRHAGLPAAGVGAAAVLLHASSRTGGPLCRPDSLLQGHAGWHILAATSLVLAACRSCGP